MTEAFWWYLLAGFLIGFSISTLWEWLYFRRRRMAIRDRRIAELEAAVRTYAAAATPSQAVATTTHDWGEPQFESPHVYLETEEPAQPASEQPASPAPNSVRTAQPSVSAVAAAMKSPPNREPSAPAKVQEPGNMQQASSLVTPFRSVAVSQPASPADAKPQSQPLASSPVQGSQSTEAAATASAMAVIQHPVATQPPTVQDAVAPPPNASPTSDLHRQTVNVVYANGYTNQRPVENPQTTSQASAAAHQAITSEDLDALAMSINELISTLNRASAEAKKDVMAEKSLHAAQTRVPPTPTVGRMERILVRLVQAMAQFMRQVRAIVTGREMPATEIGVRAPDADDLTRIEGLTLEQAQRLRVAGVTTFERLAALSPDELRLLTLTPGSGAVDVERWRAQAARLAVIGHQEPCQP